MIVYSLTPAVVDNFVVYDETSAVSPNEKITASGLSYVSFDDEYVNLHSDNKFCF